MNKTTIGIIIFFLLTFASCNEKKPLERPTEVIVIGTQHHPSTNFNPQILLELLEKVQPDFILQEQDSASFDTTFQFVQPQTENEGIASTEYIKKYPSAQLRPYEFEGRNQYRIDNGMRPTDKLTFALLDSLFQSNLLTDEEADIYTTYQESIEPLKVLASQSPKAWNTPVSDSLCKFRQTYQYQMLPKITNAREEFTSRYVTKPNGEKINYREGFQLWANFWDTRNQTMAQNILKVAKENEGKRLVVLCGFMHRYYLIEELKKYQQEQNIVLKEFYDL